MNAVELMKVCESCGINPVRSEKATRCETCHIAVVKMAASLAQYRHRERVKKQKARHNMTYGGAPTKYAIQDAITTLRKAGVLK